MAPREGDADAAAGADDAGRFDEGVVAAFPDSVEAGDDVEIGSRKRQGEHVADAQIALWATSPGDSDQFFRGVKACHAGASFSGERDREPRTAHDVQQRGAFAHAERVEEVLVRSSGVRLDEKRPVPSRPTPRPARFTPIVRHPTTFHRS